MRILSEQKQPIKSASIYLTVDEAEQLRDELTKLLGNPEKNEHFHINDATNPSRDLSGSVYTEKKLKNLEGYNKYEQKMFAEE